jgi:hypothetical protein
MPDNSLFVFLSPLSFSLGTRLQAWEQKYIDMYGDGVRIDTSTGGNGKKRRLSNRYWMLVKELRALALEVNHTKTVIATDNKLIARMASEKTTSRFVLMDELERAKRSEPGPSDYQTAVVHRDFGIDGFTQKISNSTRDFPCHNYKQHSANKLVLLQKDNSYLDVGPGQYEPTRGPAMNSSKHAPPQIPILNPRSRASASKMFTNSQLLPSATVELNSSVILAEKEQTMAKSTLSSTWKSDSKKSRLGKDDIWWSTGPGLTQRNRPYGNYKGGKQSFVNDSRIQPAFIAENTFVQQKRTHRGMQGTGRKGPADVVERFLVPVPHPQEKQSNGPKLLPMRMHLCRALQEKERKTFLQSIDADKRAVLDL